MSFLNVISDFLNSLPQWLSSFIIALMGAVVGGWFTLRGVDREAKITRAEAEKNSLELQLSVLKGIKGEIFTLITLYNKRMQNHIDNIGPGKILPINFPVGDDNFTFYEQNAKIIAKLNDEARDSIINIYTYARSLIQSFKGNNQLVVDYEKILFDMADNNKDKDMYERLHAAKIEVMVDYAQGIKNIDAELRCAIDEGFNVINQEIAALQVKLTSLEL
ncbi:MULTISPECIES: hypothetical protein [Enterobacter]|jgi:hypothetical protein|uniref:Uncharacterized protein n=9 Tax=Enterobacter cloacae complex TaxID=354276 RepID=A0AAE8X5B4_9ENTR|nr:MULTISPECIES: hypothetical protein [Enterobacter]AVO82768.1 hypothetical protein AM472_10115 [Enterobacter cloacae complex sp.]CAE7564235.1 hypothetical protein AI2759V1_1074 [Enterobacter cloacae]ATW94190.1 hypothetical protein CU081_22035 [Enterobacter sp. CRENT-193]EHF4934561.1 hypothetical protein [Enterobacter hormaechei]EHF4995314.1 hypothetical protein [Enterobacter hormaechei]